MTVSDTSESGTKYSSHAGAVFSPNSYSYILTVHARIILQFNGLNWKKMHPMLFRVGVWASVAANMRPMESPVEELGHVRD